MYHLVWLLLSRMNLWRIFWPGSENKEKPWLKVLNYHKSPGSGLPRDLCFAHETKQKQNSQSKSCKAISLPAVLCFLHLFYKPPAPALHLWSWFCCATPMGLHISDPGKLNWFGAPTASLRIMSDIWRTGKHPLFLSQKIWRPRIPKEWKQPYGLQSSPILYLTLFHYSSELVLTTGALKVCIAAGQISLFHWNPGERGPKDIQSQSLNVSQIPQALKKKKKKRDIYFSGLFLRDFLTFRNKKADTHGDDSLWKHNNMGNTQ